MRKRYLFLYGLMCLVAQQVGAQSLPAKWINGENCGTEPNVQVHEYAEGFFILRQSLCTHFEAPFLYLFMGTQRALLLDTGASDIGLVPLIDSILATWQQQHAIESLPLVVAHSHSHSDHVFADEHFKSRPDTQVVGLKAEEVAQFFQLQDWPNHDVTFELGGRTLGILPVPGHEDAHIAVYDAQTHTLLTGDSLYPGRLYFRQKTFEEFRNSMQRLLLWTQNKPIKQVLGAHIEMTKTPGQDYSFEIKVHRNERTLSLGLAHLTHLINLLKKQPKPAVKQVSEHFIVYPLD